MKKNLLYVLCLVLCLFLVGCGKYESSYSLDKKIDLVKEITGEELDAKIEEISKDSPIGSYKVTAKSDDGNLKITVEGKYIVEKGEDDKLIHSEILTSKQSNFSFDFVTRSYVKDNYIYTINSNGEQTKEYVEKPFFGLINFDLDEVFNIKEEINRLKNENPNLKIQCGYDSAYNLVIEIENNIDDENSKCRYVYKDNNLVYCCFEAKSEEKTTSGEIEFSYDNVKLEYPKELVFEEESNEE